MRVDSVKACFQWIQRFAASRIHFSVQPKKALFRMIPDVLFAFVALALLYLRWGMYTANGMSWNWSVATDGGLFVRNAMPQYEWVDTEYRMVKRPGYSLWLQWCHDWGLGPVTANLLIWTLAALVGMIAIRWATGKRFLSYLLFAVILWLPCGFSPTVGYQLYRNALIAPIVVLLVGLLSLNVLIARLDTRLAWAVRIPVSILLGMVMAFSWMLKEDAAWLLPLTGVALILAVVSACFGQTPWRIRLISMLLALAAIPVSAVIVNTTVDSYEEHFGVRLLETRTEGELGDLWRNIMSINSADRTMQVWTSKDQIRQAFDASPTLRSITGLEEALTTPGGYLRERGDDYEGSYQGELRGEYLQWQLRYAISQTQGGWPGEVWIQNTFSKVNDELEAAFRAGTLTRANGISPMSSMPAYTWGQLTSLIPRFIQSMECLMNPAEAMQLPEIAPVNVTDTFQQEGVEWLRLDVSGKPSTFINHASSIHIIRGVQIIWSVFAWSGLAAILVAPIIMITRRNYRGLIWWLFAISFGLYAAAYLFAETWYASYLEGEQFIGSVEYNALPCGQPLYAIAACLGIAALMESFRPKKGDAGGMHNKLI